MKYISKEKVEETIPAMVNNEWVELEDSVKIVFEFTDGDGDLGYGKSIYKSIMPLLLGTIINPKGATNLDMVCLVCSTLSLG